ncbi:MAG TPA: MGMT family protein [Steroidobacteraceae bacterium]|jgi:methylated-DNA-protein-cysteine methyltransferase-like protein|nr:MGMT family protein [Steroidobacteraceae bacterium]
MKHSRKKPKALLPSSRVRRVGARKRSDEADNPALQAFWHAVYAIPRGQVSTYGAVATAAGFPGRPRQTGYALKMAPRELELPWHRVLGAGGRIVFPKASREHREQARRLRAEGVQIENGRVRGFEALRVPHEPG